MVDCVAGHVSPPNGYGVTGRHGKYTLHEGRLPTTYGGRWKYRCSYILYVISVVSKLSVKKVE